MSTITFLFKGGEVLIKCEKKEKMVTIIQRFCDKEKINKSNASFFFNGKILDEHITEDKIPMNDKNKKFILVDYNSNDDEKDSIMKSKDIICPICQESAILSMDDNYKISITGCKNEHKVVHLTISEFEKSQNINLSKIICDKCKTRNMGNVFNNEFYKCNNCNMNLCPLCKKEHNLNHDTIKYENKLFICDVHGEPFISYCNDCKNNLCFTCEEKHDKHNITDFKKLRKNKNDLEKELNKSKEYLETLKKTADKCIKEFTEIWDKVIKNYEIIYKFKKDIFSSMEQSLRNFQKLSNQEFIFKQYDEFFLANIDQLQTYYISANIFKLFQKMESEPIVNNEHFGFLIYIRTLTGKAFPLKIHYSDTVETLKVKIWEKGGIAPYIQRLAFEGNLLEDGKGLIHCGVQVESTIYVIYRLL